ncbi:hypothetical protein Glove_461g93 [Diversispora epigaea]|uniref:Uncharacterized protein n=1 Tax=Diversispora epigaea TaxID=1348612 RepID=A0A397GWM0_9GLOM|nr:hypothetical protein Glove_461g93 [Diversispora epigaea]
MSDKENKTLFENILGIEFENYEGILSLIDTPIEIIEGIEFENYEGILSLIDTPIEIIEVLLKIVCEQNKLLRLIQELFSPVESEIAEIKKKKNENFLTRLYQKVLKAENCVIQAYQEEIWYWYYYIEEFKKKVKSIRDNNRRIDDVTDGGLSFLINMWDEQELLR